MSSIIFPSEFKALKFVDDGSFFCYSNNTLHFCSLLPSINNMKKPIPFIRKFDMETNKKETIEQLFDDITYKDKWKMFYSFDSKKIESLSISIKQVKAYSALSIPHLSKTVYAILLSDNILKFYFYSDSFLNTLIKIFDYSDLFEMKRIEINKILTDIESHNTITTCIGAVYAFEIMYSQPETFIVIGHMNYIIIWSCQDFYNLENWSVKKVFSSTKLVLELYFIPSNKKLLCATFYDGTAFLYHFDFENSCENNETLFADEDEMPIHNLYYKNGKLFASKAQFIFIWILNLNNDLVVEQLITKYFETPSPYHITNYCEYNDNLVIIKPDYVSSICTKSLKIGDKFVFDWDQTLWKVVDLIYSLNSALLITALDQLIHYKLKGNKNQFHKLYLSPQLTVESIIPILLSNEKPLRYIYDYLFILRMDIYKNCWPSQILELLKSTTSFHLFSITKLKLIRFFYLLKTSTKYDYKKSNDKIFIYLEKLIISNFLRFALDLLGTENCFNFSNEEKLSIYLMKNFLKSNDSEEVKPFTNEESIDETSLYRTNSAFLNKYEQILDKIISDVDPFEKCVVCMKEIKLDSLHESKCEKGHKFGRCSQTLLSCIETPYRKCPVCSSIAKISTDTSSFFYRILSNYCVFCDAPLTVML